MRTANSRRKKAPELAGSHSSKLWHRAPLEISVDLSHVRKTLDPGIPVLPNEASLDAAGQWLLCCAGASPTEGPFQFRREWRTPTNVLKQSNSGPSRVSSRKQLIKKKSCQVFIKIFLPREDKKTYPFSLPYPRKSEASRLPGPAISSILCDCAWPGELNRYSQGCTACRENRVSAFGF